MKKLLNNPPYLYLIYYSVTIIFIISCILSIILSELDEELYNSGPKIWKLHYLPITISLLIVYLSLCKEVSQMYLCEDTIIIYYPIRFVHRKKSVNLNTIKEVSLSFTKNYYHYNIMTNNPKEDSVNISIGDNERIKETLRIFRDLGICIEIKGNNRWKKKYMPD